MASVALGFAGQAVGTFFGGPLGGRIGGAIGSLLGGLIDNKLFPVKMEGPRLTDLSVQGSQYGVAIPAIFGPENRIAGNVIWSSGLIETMKKVRQGGKGGPSVSTKEYSYRTHIAVALGGGPLKGIRKIWANTKLIYDASESESSGLYSAVRFYPGDFSQLPDPNIEADKGMGNTPAYRGTAYVVIADFQLADYGNRLPNLEFLVEGAEKESVGQALYKIVVDSGIDPNLVSFGSTPSESLRGYVVGNTTSAEAAIQPLSLAWNFDLADQAGNLRFQVRDRAPVGVITLDDLGAHEGEDVPDPLEWNRAVETSLPRQSSVTFSDPERDYQPNTQSDVRTEGSADSNLDTQLAMVMTADQGRQTASRLLWEAWNGRQTATGALTDRWRHVLAGQLYLFETPAGLEPLRVKNRSRGVNGIIEIELSRDNLEVYRSTTRGAEATVPDNPVRAPAPARPILLDLPLLLDADNNSAEGFYYGAYAISGGGWRGADVFMMTEPNGSLIGIGTQSAETTVGTGRSNLVALPSGFDVDEDWDDTSVLSVELFHSGMTLEGLSDADVLAGGNAAYIGPTGGPGGEIIQFGVAVQTGPTTWELSHLRRGQKGTNTFATAHGNGQQFVLLELGSIQRASTGFDVLNSARYFKAVGMMTSPDDAQVVTFTNTGIGLRPYSPTDLAVAGPAPGDLTLSFVRRSRVGWPAQQPPPLAEETEAFQLQIMDGATVKRTVELTTTSFVYTSAMQTTDFGAPVTSLTWRVAQRSATFGLGPRETFSGPV